MIPRQKTIHFLVGMKMNKLLICGDSFSSNYKCVNKNNGWVNLLEQDFKVTNLSQPGCCEYKILKQLKSIDLKNFDKIIVSHTSPNRVYVREHPVHKNSILHKNSSFLYSDVEAHVKDYPVLQGVFEFFQNYFDIEYYEYIHSLLCREIEDTTPIHTLHITHIDWVNLYPFKNTENFYNIFKKYRGDVNHYNKIGNEIVYKKIIELLKKYV